MVALPFLLNKEIMKVYYYTINETVFSVTESNKLNIDLTDSSLTLMNTEDAEYTPIEYLML